MFSLLNYVKVFVRFWLYWKLHLLPVLKPVFWSPNWIRGNCIEFQMMLYYIERWLHLPISMWVIWQLQKKIMYFVNYTILWHTFESIQNTWSHNFWKLFTTYFHFTGLLQFLKYRNGYDCSNQWNKFNIQRKPFPST